MSVAPLFSLSAFGRGNFAFPLLLESTQLLEEGSFNPKGHVWPLLSPSTCRIGDRHEGSFQVLASHGGLDQTLRAFVPGCRDGCRDTALVLLARAPLSAFLQQRHNCGGRKGSQQQPGEGQTQPGTVHTSVSGLCRDVTADHCSFPSGNESLTPQCPFYSLIGM